MTETPREMQTLTCRMDPARVETLNTSLGVPGSAPRPFAHQVYFWDAQPKDNLGRDGHPKTGGLIPDMGLPRRMWAGGRLQFFKDLELGLEARKQTVLQSTERKTGRAGPLALVTLSHEIFQGKTLCVREEQDLVYLNDPSPDAPKPVPPAAATDETSRQVRSFDATDLFRYSALTFNGHRIHYDRDYCREVEGYPGLVVHGPLLAQYLMIMAQDLLGGLGRFGFRATAPFFDLEEAEFCARSEGDGLVLWVRGPDGRQCMRAEASP
ncbi:MAG: acyl dehydratase [Litoreibacter sp.]|nr:acyl dehydratase [Litoreibacter sp.]